MFNNASHLNVGDVTQINAHGFNRSGSVNVSDGGQYSSNVEIHAGVYQEIRGDDTSLNKLYTHITPAAMHNSAARVDAPKCHEDTRKAVQDDIFSWMSHGTADEVLWLTGPAGAGKSAIMGTVCDRLKESGQLAATFFFAAYLGRTSKQDFITTLAYQLQRHPDFRGQIAEPMLAAIRHDPAIFEMSLMEQSEILILQPLRFSRSRRPSNSTLAMAIVIDGVDECGEATYGDSGRSRQGDQLEVLSVLLQAIRDPAFPFRVIIASRPETWIRGFFTNLGTRIATEIFLDDKYSPDDDIRLFLKAKFTELSRRYCLDPSTWPTEAVINKLVWDASGQFIYVATVLRFIDTPGTLPQAQLEVVLKINLENKLNPFSALDALYTSILQSSPSPEGSVLWLKALHRIQRELGIPEPSAWTVDRIFESSAGQAQILLGMLPSLIHTASNTTEATGSALYRDILGVSAALTPKVGWTTSYGFYHKSFPDYLEEPSRCGAAFPGVDDGKVRQWLAGRFAQTLKCGGPEVPIPPELLVVFQTRFLDALVPFLGIEGTRWRMDDGMLSRCKPSVWLDIATHLKSQHWPPGHPERVLYIYVHRNCRSYCPCNPGCKRWRQEISKLPRHQWWYGWTSFGILLDRFNVRRLRDV